MFGKTLSILASTLLLASPAAARTLDLTFWNTSDNGDFNTAGNLEMRYLNVAWGINATIRAHDVFDSNRPDRHGQNRGDTQINMAAGEQQTFTFTLWDATVGDGFSALFDPLYGFSYTLGFFDIDASSNFPLGTFDEVSFSTDGQIEVSDTTDLNPRTSGGVSTFDGMGTGGLVRNDMTQGLSQDQLDAMVLVHLRNEAEFTFSYRVGIMPNDPGRSGRNLVVDGDDLRYALAPERALIPTPLPSGMALIMASLGALGAVSARQRRKHATAS